jgi:hypothetical protein
MAQFISIDVNVLAHMVQILVHALAVIDFRGSTGGEGLELLVVSGGDGCGSRDGATGCEVNAVGG